MDDFKIDWNEEEVIRAVDQACLAAIEEGAEAVLEDAKKRCPTGDSGALKESGRVATFVKDDAVGAYVKFGGQGHMVGDIDTYYAPFVELGTPGTRYKSGKKRGKERTPVIAKPFLRPALRRNKTKIKKNFEGKLKE